MNQSFIYLTAGTHIESAAKHGTELSLVALITSNVWTLQLKVRGVQRCPSWDVPIWRHQHFGTHHIYNHKPVFFSFSFLMGIRYLRAGLFCPLPSLLAVCFLWVGLLAQVKGYICIHQEWQCASCSCHQKAVEGFNFFLKRMCKTLPFQFCGYSHLTFGVQICKSGDNGFVAQISIFTNPVPH